MRLLGKRFVRVSAARDARGQMEPHHLRADGRAALPHDDISGREHPRHLPRGRILESQGGISGGLSERLSLRRHPLRHRTDSHRQNAPHARAYPDGLCRLRRFTDSHRRLRAHRQMGRRGRERRIDNQLRGRCARQGDPGSSKFFLSLEDDLMRLFGSDNISSIMDKLGMEEDEPIEHKLVTRSIESAQKKVEARNFAIRKQVLEYDDVMNQQREVIYAQRKKILQQANLRDTIMDMIHKVVDRTMAMYAPPEVYSEDWDLQALIAYAEEFYAPADLLQIDYLQNLSREELEEYLHKVADEHYAEREDAITPELMRELENLVMLKVVDNHWMEHLDSMDLLREGVGLRAYGQKDPLVEYKFEAYDMFQAMIDAIQDDVVRYIYRVNVVAQPKVENRLENASTNNPGEGDDIKKQPLVKGETTGRNDLCPCGSGKKYKNCCGQDK